MKIHTKALCICGKPITCLDGTRGAHLPDAGIYRPVKLCKVKCGRFDSVYICQNHEEGRCTLDFDAAYLVEEDGNYEVHVTVTSPKGETFKTVLSKEGCGSLTIENPELWWVNGLGAQPLYEVEAVLFVMERQWIPGNGESVFGTMTMQRNKDEWGESFAHEINGKAFFAMGADYIPEEHLLGKRSKERTRQLLMDCKLANYNVIRVWGGGFYPMTGFLISVMSWVWLYGRISCLPALYMS